MEESSLTQQQKKYLAPLDTQLAALNYRPVCTYRMTNYGSNLLRQYLNPADPASCTLTIVEVQSNVNGVRAVKTTSVINFTTRFSGDQVLTTRNMELQSIMDAPEYRLMQECPNTTDVALLKKKHDSRAATLGAPFAPPSEASAIFEEGQKDHERFCAYQVQRGILRLNPGGTAYNVTDKAFNRGIRNHFNPFAKRISPTVALFSVLIGAVLPLFGILRLAPAVAERVGPDSHNLLQPATLAIAACYVLAGVLLGLIAESQNYVWIMLITYVPAHLVAGAALGWFPYSSIAHIVSYTVCQAKRKRQMVLQS